MKHFFLSTIILFFLITSCGAMEKIWMHTHTVTAQDYRNFLEKRDIKMSDEQFVQFEASLTHLDRVKEQGHNIFQDNDSQEEDDTKILVQKADTTQSQ